MKSQLLNFAELGEIIEMTLSEHYSFDQIPVLRRLATD
jgi:hypothetical protein